MLVAVLNNLLELDSLSKFGALWPPIAENLELSSGVFCAFRILTIDRPVVFSSLICGEDWLPISDFPNLERLDNDPFVIAARNYDATVCWRELDDWAKQRNFPGYSASPMRQRASFAGIAEGCVLVRDSPYQVGTLTFSAVTSRTGVIDERQFAFLGVLLPHLHELLLRPRMANVPALSPREREVLMWASRGKSGWEVAQILNISERTVKFHLRNLYRKLDVEKRSEAVARALRDGLLGID